MIPIPGSLEIPPATNSDVHQLDPHLTFQWINDGKIMNLVLTDINRTSVNAFVDTTIQILKTAPKDQKLLFLLDVSALGGTSAHMRSRLKDIRTTLQSEGKYVRAAVIIPSGGLGMTLFLFLRQVVSGRLTADVMDELFQEREQGLQWLLNALKD